MSAQSSKKTVTTKKKTARKTTVKKTTAAKKSVRKTAVRKRPAPVSDPSSLTIVIAKIDIGWGNTLFIRGNGPGLSWDRGVAMENIDSEEWQWTCRNAKSEFLCKFLVNDISWSAGDDFEVKPGEKHLLESSF